MAWYDLLLRGADVTGSFEVTWCERNPAVRALHGLGKIVSVQSVLPWRGLRETFTAVLLGITFAIFFLYFLTPLFSLYMSNWNHLLINYRPKGFINILKCFIILIVTILRLSGCEIQSFMLEEEKRPPGKLPPRMPGAPKAPFLLCVNLGIYGTKAQYKVIWGGP